MNRSVWRRVISAIEDAIPLYDQVNEIVSNKRASKARTYAARKLLENHPHLVLDSGAGPGSMSLILLQRDTHADLVAFDYSSQLLKTCNERLRNYRNRLLLVRGCFEQLPFRSDSFDAAVTAYALRDSTDLNQAIGEYARSIKKGGHLVVVDLGKPDSAVKRFFANVYVRFVMPSIAWIIISGRLEGNPWRRIPPTYRSLPNTQRLLRVFEARFDVLEKREFLAGGILATLLRCR